MKKFKFTVIDFAIIIVFLAVIAIGIKVLGGNIDAKGDSKEVYVTVLTKAANEGISETINGDKDNKVAISYAEEAYATVVNSWEEPHEVLKFVDGKGEYQPYVVDGECDVYVKIKCDALVTDTEINCGNVPLRVGEALPICGKGYALSGYIIDIEESEGGKVNE